MGKIGAADPFISFPDRSISGSDGGKGLDPLFRCSSKADVPFEKRLESGDPLPPMDHFSYRFVMFSNPLDDVDEKDGCRFAFAESLSDEMAADPETELVLLLLLLLLLLLELLLLPFAPRMMLVLLLLAPGNRLDVVVVLRIES